MFQEKKFLKLDESGYRIEKKQVPIQKSETTIQFLMNASEMGFSLALPIVLGAFFGLWLDGKFQTQPMFTMSFLFVGIFFSFARLFIIVRDYSKPDKKPKINH